MKTILFFFAAICFSVNLSFACGTCLEAPINGSECVACAPGGWAIHENTPDVCNSGTTWAFCDLDSYDGGGIAAIGAAPGYYEAIIYTFTNLTAGLTYYTGFEAYKCIGNGTLEVTVGEEEYSYTLGDEFEELFFCFTAESTEVDIIFQTTETSTVTFNLLDYLPCHYVESLSPECSGTLFVDIEEEEITLCPGDEHILKTIITPYTGNESILWESDPPEGMDYLDDSNPLEPLFLLPNTGEFEGGEYIFSIYVDDGECDGDDEITVTVTPSLTPDFEDLFACGNGTLDDLPVESEDGYLGYWDGPTPFEDYEGENVTFTFYINSNQDNCKKTAEYDVYIIPIETPEFSFPLEYCSNDSSLYILPEISDNQIYGEWEEADFFPYELPIGYSPFLFTPDEEDHPCNDPLYFDIEVIPSLELSFNIPSSFCLNDTYTFPRVSLEQVEGNWSLEYIDTITIAGSYQTIFKPTDADCGEEYLHSFDIIDLSLVPTITDPTQCDSSDGSILFSSALDIEYSIDTGRTWVDIGQFSDLSASAYQVIYRYSQNGICPDTLDLVLNGSDSPTVEDILITDNSDCSIDNGKIEITSSPSDPYEFSIDNGISWQQDSVFTNLSEGSYNLTVRYASDPSCLSDYPFEVGGIQLPDLIGVELENVTDCDTQDGTIELLAAGTNLEYSIDGGLSYSSLNIFQNLDTGTYNIVIISDGENCEVSDMIFIGGPVTPAVLVSTLSPSSCIVNDGAIKIESNRLSELEFSIDNGMQWQTSDEFTDLGPGGYTLLYRLIDSPSCSDIESVLLVSPDVPEIDDIEHTNNTSCITPNGTILITTSVPNLEFSIDDGNTWSTDASYDNLTGGEYFVQARLASNPDCLFSQSVIIEDFQIPTIDDILITDVSNCGEDDGTVEIVTTGSDLLFELENYAPYQSQNVFTGLPPGEYTINVLVENSWDCIASSSITIGGPTQPDLQVSAVSNATACNRSNGSINLVSAYTPATELEFSIDGLSWQDDGIFLDLSDRDYIAYVRLKQSPNCLSELAFTVGLEAELLEQVEVISTNPTDCIVQDGIITIEVRDVILDMEYSIDNNNWQTDGVFSNLLEGFYTCYVRGVSSPLCTYQVDIQLIAPQCPCENYNLSSASSPVLCNLELGSIQVNLSNDETILWQNGSGQPYLSELNSGWYHCTITYQDGLCEHTDSVFVDEVEAIDFILESFPVNCEGENNGLVEIVDISGGDGNYNYSLDGSSYQQQSGFYNLAPGTYDMYVTDNTGCVSNEEFIIDLANQNIDLVLPQNLTLNLGETITLNPLINGATIDSFVWSPSDYIIDGSELVIDVKPEEDINYTLTVYYGDGCIHVRTISINVLTPKEDIYIPNIIESNDPENEIFYIRSSDDFQGRLISISVFDRWGNKVFSKENPEPNNPDDGWDPRRDYKVIQGVYVYMIEYEANARVQQDLGTITVIR